MPGAVSVVGVVLLVVGGWLALVAVGLAVLTVAARADRADDARGLDGGGRLDGDLAAGTGDHLPSVAAARLALLVGRELGLDEARVQEAALAAAWFARDARWTPLAIGDAPPGDAVERDLARLCASVATERHTPEVIPLVSAAYERVTARAS